MYKLIISRFQAYPFRLVFSLPRSIFTPLPLCYPMKAITRSLWNISPDNPWYDVSMYSKDLLSAMFYVDYKDFTDKHLLMLKITEKFFLMHIDDDNFDEDLLGREAYIINTCVADIGDYMSEKFPGKDGFKTLLEGLNSDPDYYISLYQSILCKIYLTK